MFHLNLKVIRMLWALSAISMLVGLRVGLFIFMGLAILYVVAYWQSGPVGGWNVTHLRIGFLGWFVMNTFLGMWILNGDWQGDPWGFFRGAILLFVNFLVLLVLIVKGGQIIIGALLALLVNAIGMLLFVDLEEFGSFLGLPFYLYFFYPNL